MKRAYVYLVKLDDTLNLEEARPTKKSRTDITDSQRLKLEEASKKIQHEDADIREASISSILARQVQADLSKKYANLLLKYNNLLSDKSQVTGELKQERLKNHQLNEKVRKITKQLTYLQSFRDQIRQAYISNIERIRHPRYISEVTS